MSERSSLLCLQFRNAKYQGAVADGRVEGLGIMIDSEYLWAISEWRNEQPEGPSLVVFPNREYYWGKMVQGQPQGVGLYRLKNGDKYVLNRVNNTQQDIACIQGRQVSHIVLNKGKLSLTATHRAQSEEETWQLAERIIQGTVPIDQRSGYQFVKSQISAKHAIIECSQQSGGEWIGFAGEPSLGIKFVNDDVHEVGGYELFPRRLEFGKKIHPQKGQVTQVQEGDFANEKTMLYIEGKRPPEATKQTEVYFKRGTNFKDRFLSFRAFEELSVLIGDVKQQHAEETIGTYGQRILEESNKNEFVEREGQRREKLETTKTYTLDEVRQDIVSAVQRRQRGGGRVTPVTGYSPERKRYSPPASPGMITKPRSRSKEHYQYLRDAELEQRDVLRREAEARYQLEEARHQIENQIRAQERLRDYARHTDSYEEVSSYYQWPRTSEPLLPVNPLPRRTKSPYGKNRFNYVEQPTEASPIKRIFRPEANDGRIPTSIEISPYKNYINYKQRTSEHSVTPPKRYDAVERRTGYNEGSASPINPGAYPRTHHKRSYKYV